MAVSPIYNERSDFDLAISLVDKDGDPLTPTVTKYRIHDQASGTVVQDWKEITVLAGEGTISITADDLAIVNDDNGFETRIVTLSGEYGVDKEFYEEYEFHVKNLYAVPMVEEET